MVCKNSIKIDDNSINFLKRFRTNRRKVGRDDKDLAYWELLNVIGNYFKINNDNYLDIVNMEFQKC